MIPGLSEGTHIEISGLSCSSPVAWARSSYLSQIDMSGSILRNHPASFRITMVSSNVPWYCRVLQARSIILKKQASNKYNYGPHQKNIEVNSTQISKLKPTKFIGTCVFLSHCFFLSRHQRLLNKQRLDFSSLPKEFPNDIII